MDFLKKQWFLAGLILLLILGFTVPGIGASLSFGGLTTTMLIVLIFFITGLKIPTEAIARGLKGVRLHLFLQIFIFVVTPLYFAGFLQLFSGWFLPEVKVGIIALAVLPTTISSCVIFTQAAGGNTVGAMVNAALANLLGVVVSPFLLSLLLKSSASLDTGVHPVEVAVSIGLKIVLPLIVGQIVRRRYVPSLGVKKKFSIATNLFLLGVIYINFSTSASDPAFKNQASDMIGPFVFLALSFFILLGLSRLGARLLKCNREDTITVLFTAPQKTLAMGVPLLTTFFADAPELIGVALLPLLFYHPWQLLASGFMKGLLVRGSEAQR